MQDNRVVANHIHHIAQQMSDTAGVYTLSAQPGTVIEENHIHSITMSPYVHDSDHWFYLYLDEGSSEITVETIGARRSGSCPMRLGQATCGRTTDQTSPKRSNAWLQPEYRDLLEHAAQP